MTTVPNYLKDYADLYGQEPRKANIEWFRNARYGLFLHYGLYSLLGRHEWVQLREMIPVTEYTKLADRFTAERFAPEAIADFAVDCGMRYVNITTRHHDSFCLFDTKETPFKSTNAPARRDLVAELAAACDKRGLGLCLYYSHGRDWRHPHAPNNDQWGGSARPQYPTPDPAYAYGDRHDLNQYVDFLTKQVTELLTQYGPVASIWLDGIAVPISGDYSKFRCQELYDLIHSLQPQVLVSYKQGLLGTEDYFAPEYKVPTASDPAQRQGKMTMSAGKMIEVCSIMAPKAWGYTISTARQHKKAAEVWEELGRARRNGFNLLLNTGPLPDGSLDPEDEVELRAVGERIRREGWPV